MEMRSSFGRLVRRLMARLRLISRGVKNWAAFETCLKIGASTYILKGEKKRRQFVKTLRANI
jgi:hypothetical protein